MSQMQILRLPPYHSMLNPIEHAWAWIKAQLKHGISTVGKLTHIADVAFQLFDEFTPEMARKYVEHGEKEEAVKRTNLVQFAF
jgi:hypothetical protein